MNIVEEFKDIYDSNKVNKDFLSHRKYNTKKNANTLSAYLYYIFYSARGNAKYRGLQFTLTQMELFNLYQQQEGLCAISKIPMTHLKTAAKKTRINNYNVSIDRINSKKGYSIDNIQLVCASINVMKLDHTPSEFIELCRKVVESNATT